jgi:diadenylate cyclase
MSLTNITLGWDTGVLNFWVSLIIISLIFAALLYIYIRIIKRKTALITLIISYVLVVLALIFNAIGGLIFASVLTGVCVSVTFFANLGDLRSFIAAPFKRANAKNGKFGVEKIYNRAELYKQVENAVMQLSKTRTGALITFERNTTLKDIMKNGVPIHAPLTAELLLTIFYPGTRLHDGAVVVHGNEIIAASVFFTPTTKPFAGKYGSRHRAAIGISEVSDSITVVVSEESGRISIAADGELNVVDPANFITAFETYMSVIDVVED